MKETEPYLKLDAENNWNWTFESEYFEPLFSTESEHDADDFFEEHRYALEDHNLLLDDHIHPKTIEARDLEEVSIIQTGTSFQENLYDIQHKALLVSDSDGESIDKESITSFNNEELNNFSMKNEDITVSASNNNGRTSVASNAVPKVSFDSEDLNKFSTKKEDITVSASNINDYTSIASNTVTKVAFDSEEVSNFSMKNEDTAVSTTKSDVDTSITSNAVTKPVEKECANKPGSEENSIKFNPADVMEQLRKMMAISAESHKKLQNWDEKRGLPKNHSVTMMNTGRSRLQLQDGVILLKWDGSPLTEGLRKIGRRKPAQKRESAKQGEIPKKRGRGRPRKVKNIPKESAEQVEFPKKRGRGRPQKVKNIPSK